MTASPEQRVLEAVASRVQGWYGTDARLSPDVGVRRRPWSIHFLPTVEHAAGPTQLVVKIPLWEQAPDLAAALAAGPQASTQREFDTLVRIGGMTGGAPNLAAVRPLEYLEGINAVVTEVLDSRSLREIDPASRDDAAASIGEWLRLFHDRIGEARERTFTADDADRLIDGLDPMFGPRGLRKAIGALRAEAEGLVGSAVRMAVTHGDFGPSNVLVEAGGRVAVIDPNLVDGPVEADAAKLAALLRTPRWRLLTGMRLVRGLTGFEQGMAEGYGGWSDGLYRLCRRIESARRWVGLEERPSLVRRPALPIARRVLGGETR